MIVKAAGFWTLGAAIVAIVLIAFSVPLALNKVPPNASYGFRTAKSQSSSVLWYRENQFSGSISLAAGALMLVLSGMLAALLRNRALNERTANVLAIAVGLGPLALLFISLVIYDSRLQ